MLTSCKGKKVDPSPKIHSYSSSIVESNYRLEVVESSASCEGLRLINEKGEHLNFSSYLNELLLSCPTHAEVIDGQLFFHDSDKNALMICDIFEEKIRTLQAMEDEEEEFSYVVKSPDKKHFLFATIYQARFPTPGSLYHFISVNNQKFERISKHEVPLNYVCGSRCVAQDFKIDDNGTIHYKRNINYDERPGEWELIPFTP